MYYVYVLESEFNGTHYYGHTGCLTERLKVHNAGKVKYTKRYRPWIVIYQEIFETKSEAFRRELFFKTIDGHRFLKQMAVL